MTVETSVTEAPVKLTAEERAARAERMAREGAQAMADHHAAIRARDENTVRLRALRLAKEAEAAKEAAETKASAPKRKRSVKAASSA